LSQNRLENFGGFIEKAAWAAMLFALPVTSFPFFPRAIGGEALVRPLSLYPLIFLIPFSVIPRLFRKPLPKNILALLLFVLVAVCSSIISLFRGIEPALGISVESRVVRGLFTLAIGCAFFLTIALLPENTHDLRFSLRWIYAGLATAMVLGSLQAYYILSPSPAYFGFLENIQKNLSIRRLLFDRISGMTYEPHWFAEQIILLLLPYTLAAIMNNYTIFRWRWRRLTLEWILLGWALVLLPFTFSRAGLMNLIIVIFVGLLFFHPRNSEHVISGKTKFNRALISRSIRNVIWVMLIVTVVLTPIYLIGSRNPFFARIWSYWKNPGATFEGYLSSLGVDARVTYAQAAFNIYQAYPFLGVGLGNYAFYFEEMLPYRPIGEVTEVLLMITPELGRDRLITSKNFFLRLLAETGIVGWITFGVFLVMSIGYALYLWLSPDKEWKYWGTASLCGLVAFALSALSFDSFVIPDIWILLGFITAATRIAARTDPSIKEIPAKRYEPTLETA
jgi:hypothetical protein